MTETLKDVGIEFNALTEIVNEFDKKPTERNPEECEKHKVTLGELVIKEGKDGKDAPIARDHFVSRSEGYALGHALPLRTTYGDRIYALFKHPEAMKVTQGAISKLDTDDKQLTEERKIQRGQLIGQFLLGLEPSNRRGSASVKHRSYLTADSDFIVRDAEGNPTKLKEIPPNIIKMSG